MPARKDGLSRRHFATRAVSQAARPAAPDPFLFEERCKIFEAVLVVDRHERCLDRNRQLRASERIENIATPHCFLYLLIAPT